MPVKGNDYSLTKSGKAVKANAGRGLGLIVGVVNPLTGRIVQKPKPAVDLGIKSSGSVKITAPATMEGKQAKKYGGLGFGPVGRPHN